MSERNRTVPRVGMVGGGQLSRMTHQAGIALGVDFSVLASSPADSAALVCGDVSLGDDRGLDDVLAFAKAHDVVTFDHEHVPEPVLRAVEEAGGLLRPGRDALRFAQDKLRMRTRMAELGAPSPRWRAVTTLEHVTAFAGETGWPVVLKAARGGYDGKGVWVVGDADEARGVVDRAAAEEVPLLVEGKVDFSRELAVQVARSPHGQVAVYPVVETVQRGGICHEVIAPAPDLSEDKATHAQQLAIEIAQALDVTGVLAVELFETADGVVVNELAMRPHNSGHWSIEGARTSQFEQHLRAVLNLPLGSPRTNAPYTVMANLLGGEDPEVYRRYLHVMAKDPEVKVHFYGKDVRPGRKIGHVTVMGEDYRDLLARARDAAAYLRGDEQ
ncbi:5-(carboxyamino)imidazole ribonucleotide synthase [Nocardiopsis dassonvillei]|uniref:N5-carboxyaminoimidazole ribonucleotide synthase n=1 Tax=Nocardiopsis dassonvillei (strain ATCC 23218 / DSM 43111 / CIP 107115 / JCM 7437 / KCTC 9190 / NBRC 14626 / NCTC 10488 / NRRL B-5397 / IMRU 509) TaxID=446468 RepID=D7B6J4_NOCDD|nr:5-(carboxyamino)imidazole ribonucleotide synthase [Nocardiopsis dassonvillei]ADH69281.1 phosphoribosylaminoimidazole carboxylase, ATPase subunit [Nocardiopsis dassonvillei subsp. dassonvillei DSM 43111]NKY80625.1 5-(carboxyamino)imidazole ribonucleotide synthase [Nocardiopsis dassonvillei]VEI89790.1 N5-carboxyaminoimidazole ribonucleotide synthase [Nocardiopsis dassonvillei]